MKLAFTTAFADAVTAWRRDSAVLLPLAGVTMFLPQFAVRLLVPALEMPGGAAPGTALAGAQPDPATQAAMAEAMSAWLSQYGGWYVAMSMLGLFGGLTVMALYLAAGRPTLGKALGRGAALFLRYLLASILLGFAAMPVLMFGLVSPLLVAVLMPLAFYVLGRTMLTGPAIVGAAPIGAVDAIRRSWALTRGNGWTMAATYAAPLLVTHLVVGALMLLGDAGGANPVIVAIVDGLAALAGTVMTLALALVEVALYRRLASKGT